MKHIYAIMVWPRHAEAKLSQEAYDSLSKARAFIEARSDSPVEVDTFTYVGQFCTYTIHELTVC